MMRSRFRLLLATVVLGGLILVGCATSPVLPPPMASIPRQPVPSLADSRRAVPMPSVATRLPGQAGNPWRPAIAARDWKYIVIHHTATSSGSVESINASHVKNKDKSGNPWLGIGYHFVIGNGDGMSDGAIETDLSLEDADSWGARRQHEQRLTTSAASRICLVGNFQRHPDRSPAQKRQAARAIHANRVQNSRCQRRRTQRYPGLGHRMPRPTLPHGGSRRQRHWDLPRSGRGTAS